MVRFCLNMIVKNEGARIERALDSAGQFISCAVIVDTGSTDDTKHRIQTWCEHHHVPLQLHDAEFKDFSQARNAALAHARAAWCSGELAFEFDYLLLMDADMELKVTDRSVFDNLTGIAYDMYQAAGSVHYLNRRLLRADQPGWYVGVTHEYLDVESAGSLPEAKTYFYDHSDGANRPNKFKRDIKLLKAGLMAEPTNARYMFYLANSYRDAGKREQAAEWYLKRIKAGGWPEEVWQAQCNYAACMKALGREDQFVTGMLKAYQMRPSRAEALYDLANHYREKPDMQAVALVFAEAAAQIPYSHDSLFVNDFVYKTGILEELAICSFYVDGKQRQGFNAANKLALMETPYVTSREVGLSSMFFYLPALGAICPSFKSETLKFRTPEHWVPMNPSVTRWGDEIRCVIRTVNYRMDEQGRYLIRGIEDDGTLGTNANATNPIHTRNYLVELDDDLKIKPGAYELLPPGNFPCEWPLVIGFEDMRLFEWNGQLWTSSTVRQLCSDGNCEQVLAKIEARYNNYTFEHSWGIGEWHRMLRQPRVTEKNWAPWVHGSDLRFMYKLGETVDTGGKTLAKHPTGLATDRISGGSQLIPFYDGWLAIVHEARPLPGTSRRCYWHRFALYDDHGKLTNLTKPFYFNEKDIEFAAGLCWHPDQKHLVISYGFKDAEARIATVLASEVHRLCFDAAL